MTSFVFRAIIMLADSLVDCIKHDVKQTVQLYLPVWICLATFFAITTLPIYKE